MKKHLLHSPSSYSSPTHAVVEEWLIQFFATHVAPVRDYLMIHLGGGPRTVSMRHVINLHKGLTLFVMLGLMAYSENWDSSTAWLYTALHGTYGLVWLLKDQIIPDGKWDTSITRSSGILLFCGLSLYWFPGVHMIVLHPEHSISPVRAFCAISMHTVGVVLMMCADTQKYFVLQLKKGLIDDGWVAYCRNTNYLGELMVYSTYGVLVQHWFPWALYAFSWTIVFASSMAEKDVSLRNKVGGKEYVQKAGLLLPNLSGWAWDTFFAPSIGTITSTSGDDNNKIGKKLE